MTPVDNLTVPEWSVSEVWTHGTWTVTPGRESDFVRAWEELGEWTVRAFRVPTEHC